MNKVNSLYRQMLTAAELYHVNDGIEVYGQFGEIKGEDDNVPIVLAEHEEDTDGMFITELMLKNAEVDGSTIKMVMENGYKIELRLYTWVEIPVKIEW